MSPTNLIDRTQTAGVSQDVFATGTNSVIRGCHVLQTAIIPSRVRRGSEDNELRCARNVTASLVGATIAEVFACALRQHIIAKRSNVESDGGKAFKSGHEPSRVGVIGAI